MHKTGIALGLLVAAGAAATLAPWYTGTQLEGTLQAAISRGNEQLRNALPGANARLELVSLERGVFSSTARYRVDLGQALGEEVGPVELLFTDRIEHGPLPLSRLKALDLQPVMALSTFNLERSDSVLPWFAGAGETAPLSGALAIGYDNRVNGRVSLHPLEFASDEGRLRFSGIDLNLTLGAQAESVHIAGGMDNLSLDFTGDAGAVQVRLDKLDLTSDYRLGPSGYYVGGSRSELREARVEAVGKPPLLMQQLVLTDRVDEQGGRLSGSFDYDVGSLSYDGKPLGSAGFGMTLGNLDVAAVQQLEGWYREFMARLEAPQTTELALTADDEERLRQGLEALLAGKPSVSLDRLSLKTAGGESRFNLKLDFAKPASYELPPAELARQLVARLDARLVLAKPTIRDLISYQASLEPAADPAAVAQQASEAAEMAGMMATSMQVGRVEGDNIVTSLSYADGKVDFNGQVMPAEEFAGLLMAMVPPEALGMLSGAAAAGEMSGLGEAPAELGELVEPVDESASEMEQALESTTEE